MRKKTLNSVEAARFESPDALCGDEITTSRISCSAYTNCEVVDVSVSGFVTGGLAIENVEKQCSSGLYSCTGSKTAGELASCPVTYTVAAAPSTVVPGGVVTVNWTASQNRSTSDYIGLYRTGSANTAYLAYKYIAGGTSGTMTFTMPFSIGSYEFRYFTSNTYNLVATSNTVTVANPTPTPTPTPIRGTCNQPPPCSTGFVIGSDGLCTRSTTFQNRCLEPSGYDPNNCTCPDGTSTSPVIIDVDSSGFSLTDAANGVDFDILAVGFPQHLSWTASDSTNAFLVLDRNGNGTIDTGEELFGDVTPQPPSSEANGFLALAEYDKTANGGNADKQINKQDSIFSQLRLWQDANHNGISEANELHALVSLNVAAIDLKYKTSKRTDQYGNRFRYRAKVFDAHGAQIGRWAWDVFLVTQ